MTKVNLKRCSAINLISGYVLLFSFILLIILSRTDSVEATPITVVKKEESNATELFNGIHEPEREIVYVDGHPLEIIRDNSILVDRLHGRRANVLRDVGVVDRTYVDSVVVNDRNFVARDFDDEIRVGGIEGNIGGGYIAGDIHDDGDRVFVDGGRHHGILEDDEVDIGILDRRLREIDIDDDTLISNIEGDNVAVDSDTPYGLDAEDTNLSNLSLSDEEEGELGDLAPADFETDLNGEGFGLKKGNLYAYNFPSQGVGAGIGTAGVGAVAGIAGLGAGIGEAVLDGQAVPTLGGIGTAGPLPLEGGEAAPTDGVGGLVGGAGAGAAAGLVVGRVLDKLGLGVGEGVGGGAGAGGDGVGRGDYNWEHLPPNGSLHIMMHVDGSGSILSTRKQLDIMRDTLLKEALLPYYNNDEDLYNNRVTIVDGAGERTLQFFSEAARKPNVLAVAFQDEASPDYHLPVFNKKPQDAYKTDLNKLKSNLHRYGGLYRGIMFQVDRGRTFAKSFKEMVECAWRGQGYLSEANLQKYHRDENRHHINSKSGIVFSDEYHAKSEGDPEYYLDLLFKASKRIGLDLDINGGGLTDGKYNTKID